MKGVQSESEDGWMGLERKGRREGGEREERGKKGGGEKEVERGKNDGKNIGEDV